MSKRLTSALAAAAFAVATFAMSPASAAPAGQIAPAVKAAVETNIIEVRDRKRHHRAHRGYRDHRNWHRGHRDHRKNWHRGRGHGPRWGHYQWRRNCVQTVRVRTPWGHQWRQVNVCR